MMMVNKQITNGTLRSGEDFIAKISSTARAATADRTTYRLLLGGEVAV
jgi:hypothetical protein